MSQMMTIGPNDFVSGPYVSCPGCRQQTLDVLSVGPRQVVRRCIACRACMRSPTVLLDNNV